MTSRRDAILARILARTDLRTGPMETPCWVWTGPTSGDKGRGRDYPRMCLSGQTVAVHRVVFTHFNGYVPGKKQIDHLCKNRRCVCPEHLEIVTHAENQRRRDRK